MNRDKYYHKYYRKLYFEALEEIKELKAAKRSADINNKGEFGPKVTKNSTPYEIAMQLAAKRKKEFNLTEELYNSLIKKPCHYCQEKITHKGMRLDRKDSNVGYTASNVVACCYKCNMKKGPYLTYNEFMLIAKH